jgi:DNA repair protein RadC
MDSNWYKIKGSIKPLDKIRGFGISSLTEQELMAALVGGGTGGNSVHYVSKNILSVLQKTPGYVPEVESLLKIKGVGEVKAVQITASFELARRFLYPSKGYIIRHPKDVYEVVKLYAYHHQEVIVVITLSGSQELINCREVFKGTLDMSVTHSREIFVDALKDRAAGIIVIHNHPSGSLAPSVEDRQFTENLSQAGQLLGIPLMDHVIISREGYYSFVENKMLVY